MGLSSHIKTKGKWRLSDLLNAYTPFLSYPKFPYHGIFTCFEILFHDSLFIFDTAFDSSRVCRSSRTFKERFCKK